MEILITIFAGFAFWVLVSVASAKANSVTTIFGGSRESLCTRCVYAHIARGFNTGEELTYCTYAGVCRDVKFAVSDCSMYCDRYAGVNVVRVIGFANTNERDQSLRPAAVSPQLNADC
jgi:hypothetical protein